jgi:antitoxin ParD1/3/4
VNKAVSKASRAKCQGVGAGRAIQLIDFGANKCYQSPMSTIEKISVSLPADLIADIRAAIAQGDYATTSEVLRDALRDWKLKRKVQGMDVEELRALWKEGATDEAAKDGEVVFAHLAAKYRAKAQNG